MSANTLPKWDFEPGILKNVTVFIGDGIYRLSQQARPSAVTVI